MELVLTTDGFREWLDRWAPAAEWGVALGTIALAAATYVLARRAREEAGAVAKEAKAVEEQVKLQRDQLSAAQQPFVYPTVRLPWNVDGRSGWDDKPRYWVQVENGGTGPALNVQGSLHWEGGAGGNSSLVPTSLGAGQDADMNVTGSGIQVNWAMAHGHLRYTDLEGTEWRTMFRYRIDGSNNTSVEVTDYGRADDLDSCGANT